VLNILVVEDDDGVASALIDGFVAHGHQAAQCPRLDALWPRLRDADVVVMDLGMPDGDGLEALRKLRRINDLPVLVLTARDAERDVVRGLRLGADDYLIKPVRLRELLARIDAVLRRSRGTSTAGALAANPRVEVGDLRVDLTARRAFLTEREIGLTPKEFEVLAVLARRVGEAVSRQQMLDEIWGDAYLAVSRSLDVHITSLRAKLGKPQVIHTVRGFGYRLGD
jgi:DNA-binding response OmpR family regulator